MNDPAEIPIEHVVTALKTAKHFIPLEQLKLLRDLCRGEEREYFKQFILDLAAQIERMPHEYQARRSVDDRADDLIVQLHYFWSGDSDFWLVERDSSDEQHQAYGYCCQDGDREMAEWGYSSLVEMNSLRGMQLDLHWKPKPWREVKAAKWPELESDGRAALPRGFSPPASAADDSPWILS